MPEPVKAEPTKTAAELAEEQKWAAYNQKMVELFAERNKFPMDSTERDAAVQKIMEVWVTEG